MSDRFDIAILGCGPAGADAALKLAKGGKKVVVFEANKIGGTCLNVGCIPTKAYLYKAKTYELIKKHSLPPSLAEIQAPTQRLLKRSALAIEKKFTDNNITLIKEKVIHFSDTSLETQSGNTFAFQQLILASGTQPFIPNVFKNISNHPQVFTNENIFSLETFPTSLTIIGGGAIGIEFAFFFSAFNVAVTLIEAAPNILPNLDDDLVKEVKQLLKIRKVKLLEGALVTTATATQSLSLEVAQEAKPLQIIESSHLLLATGRSVNLPQHNQNITVSAKGFVQTNDFFQTNLKNIFALGDINGRHLLAHAASHQAEWLAEYLLGHSPAPYSALVPNVIYSIPSISSLGISQKEATQDFIISKTSYNLSGKAQAENNSEGWIKLISKEKVLYGAQIFGYNSEDLLPLLSFAIANQVKLTELTKLIFPHPSYCELLKEAISQNLEIS